MPTPYDHYFPSPGLTGPTSHHKYRSRAQPLASNTGPSQHKLKGPKATHTTTKRLRGTLPLVPGIEISRLATLHNYFPAPSNKENILATTERQQRVQDFEELPGVISSPVLMEKRVQAQSNTQQLEVNPVKRHYRVITTAPTTPRAILNNPTAITHSLFTAPSRDRG